jgi:ribonucleoside-diphosphate reductase beta chain
MFVEGVLAETGYYSFYQAVESANIMPGLLEGIGNLKKDESRHIGYGTFLLQRLICEHPHLFDFVAAKMTELTPLALRLNEEVSAFGGDPALVMDFTLRQLSVRMEILARAKGKKIEEIYRFSESELGVL